MERQPYQRHASNIIEVNVTINTSKPEQIQAFANLLAAIGGVQLAGQTETVTSSTAQVVEMKPEKEEPKEEPKPKRKRRTKAEIKAEEEAAKSEKEEAETNEKVEEDSGEEITLAEVRSKLATKVNDHRDECIAKLKELGGAKSVSALEPEYYAEFVEFLDGLE